MAAKKSVKKPASKKSGRPSRMGRHMDALYDTLSGISRLFGGSTVSMEEGGIVVSVSGFDDRGYRLDRDGTLVVTRNVGTKTRPRLDSSRTHIEEPIAFLIEYTSPNEVFNEVHENVERYVEKDLF